MTGTVADRTRRVELQLDGMTCASCVVRIERRLNRLDGVQASVNYATEEAAVADGHARRGASVSETDTSSCYTAEREMLVKRLHRIDVLTQRNARNTALEALAIKLLDGHVDHCAARALESGDPDVGREQGRELRDAVHRFARTR